MPTELDLLTGIAENPWELDRWLILSDWLEDQDDPRAELARLRYLLHVEPEHPEREKRLARQRALMDLGLFPVAPARSDNGLGMPLALILPGTFQMGSPTSEVRLPLGEILHTVTLTELYYLGVYPVTVGEFEKFVQATGYKTEAETSGGAHGYLDDNWEQDTSINWRTPGFAQTARHPVVCTSWNDAQAMAAWLNEVEVKSDLVYSLPTEAQWEYACRAGEQGAYFWGNDANKLGEYAWFKSHSGNQTHPVDTQRPNRWGLWHMSGNVWEWCADGYGQYPSGAVTNPGGCVPGGMGHVRRGGSWRDGARSCRSANRGSLAPSLRSTRLGFRLAASLQPS